MKRIFAMAIIVGSMSIAAEAGVFRIAKAVVVHVARDAYHAVKHVGHDAVSVVK